MNTLTIYYMMVASEIRIALLLLCVLFIAIFTTKMCKHGCNRSCIKYGIIAVIFGIGPLFLPSTKEMAIIVAAPPVVNKVEKAEESFNKAKTWVKEQIEKRK